MPRSVIHLYIDGPNSKGDAELVVSLSESSCKYIVLGLPYKVGGGWDVMSSAV